MAVPSTALMDMLQLWHLLIRDPLPGPETWSENAEEEISIPSLLNTPDLDSAKSHILLRSPRIQVLLHQHGTRYRGRCPTCPCGGLTVPGLASSLGGSRPWRSASGVSAETGSWTRFDAIAWAILFSIPYLRDESFSGRSELSLHL